MCSHEIRAQKGEGTCQETHSKMTANVLISCQCCFYYFSDMNTKKFEGILS